MEANRIMQLIIINRVKKIDINIFITEENKDKIAFLSNDLNLLQSLEFKRV